MKLTRKKSIELTIELWEWLAKTGKRKEDWPKWDEYEAYNYPEGSDTCACCWLCEYDLQHGLFTDGDCIHCPYYKKYGLCFDEKKPTLYNKWENAETARTRKKYAALFLERVRTLK